MNNEFWNNIVDELKNISIKEIDDNNHFFEVDRFKQVLDLIYKIENFKDKDRFKNIDILFGKGEIGYQTPKLDSRAAIFKEGKILLVEELNNKWTMPGGWVDHNLSIGENIVKESLEEAGIKVKPVKIIAVQDRKKHNKPKYIYNIIKVMVLCEYISGEFKENIETLRSGFFNMDKLPELSEDRTSLEQVELSFKAYNDESFEAFFD